MKKKYRTFRAADGRRVRVEMTEDEIAERVLYWIAITVLPFIGAAGMMWLWLKGA